MKLFITGNMGYVGSVLSHLLLSIYENVEIIGFDSCFFGHCLTGADFSPEHVVYAQHYGDVRILMQPYLRVLTLLFILQGSLMTRSEMNLRI